MSFPYLWFGKTRTIRRVWFREFVRVCVYIARSSHSPASHHRTSPASKCPDLIALDRILYRRDCSSSISAAATSGQRARHARSVRHVDLNCPPLVLDTRHHSSLRLRFESRRNVTLFFSLNQSLLIMNCLRTARRCSHLSTLHRLTHRPIAASRHDWRRTALPVRHLTSAASGQVQWKSDTFIDRHIGPRDDDKQAMLQTLGYQVTKHEIIYFTQNS
jgi:hypothetical protein